MAEEAAPEAVLTAAASAAVNIDLPTVVESEILAAVGW
jgi:hypothetical protein